MTVVGDGINYGIGNVYIGLGKGLYRDAYVITLGIYNIFMFVVMENFKVLLQEYNMV